PCRKRHTRRFRGRRRRRCLPGRRRWGQRLFRWGRRRPGGRPEARAAGEGAPQEAWEAWEGRQRLLRLRGEAERARPAGRVAGVGPVGPAAEEERARMSPVVEAASVGAAARPIVATAAGMARQGRGALELPVLGRRTFHRRRPFPLRQVLALKTRVTAATQ